MLFSICIMRLTWSELQNVSKLGVAVEARFVPAVALDPQLNKSKVPLVCISKFCIATMTPQGVQISTTSLHLSAFHVANTIRIEYASDRCTPLLRGFAILKQVRTKIIKEPKHV